MKKEEIIGLGIVAIAVVLYLTRKPIIKAVEKVKGMLTRQQFIDLYKNTVKVAAGKTGLFPSLFMAQAILESSDKNGVPGASSLAAKHNNFFGIKADKSWQGDKAILKTREVIKGKDVYVDAPFRKYATPEASFIDRVNFLVKNSRYKNAGVFSASSPLEQAKALQKAGYATDPNYATVLNGIIKKYDLTKLDS